MDKKREKLLKGIAPKKGAICVLEKERPSHTNTL